MVLTARHRLLSLFSGESGIAVDLDLGLQGTSTGLDPRALFRLWQLCRRMKPTVVVAHGGDSLKYLALSGVRSPIVYLAIGTVTAEVHQPVRRAFWRFLIGRSATVVAVSEDVIPPMRSPPIGIRVQDARHSERPGLNSISARRPSGTRPFGRSGRAVVASSAASPKGSVRACSFRPGAVSSRTLLMGKFRAALVGEETSTSGRKLEGSARAPRPDARLLGEASRCARAHAIRICTGLRRSSRG